jgi:hypothetical protein
MDELDAIRAFRAEAPEPSATARAEARQALERAMLPAERPALRWRFGVGKVLAPVGVALVILIAAALASPLFGPRGGGNAAARELHALANVAAQQASTPALTEGMYVYTRSDNLQLNTAVNANDGTSTTKLVQYTREIWIGANGSGRIHEMGQGLPTGDEWDQQFGPGGLTPPLETHGFTSAELDQLAQDPAQLAEAIRAQSGGTKNPVEEESFVFVGDLLRESDASPRLRSALFQVAANIPGVELIGTVKDPAGRPGVSVAMTYRGVRSELIFDPATSMLLAERQTLVAPVDDLDFAVGTVIGATTYLSSGIVNSTTATP